MHYVKSNITIPYHTIIRWICDFKYMTLLLLLFTCSYFKLYFPHYCELCYVLYVLILSSLSCQGSWYFCLLSASVFPMVLSNIGSSVPDGLVQHQQQCSRWSCSTSAPVFSMVLFNISMQQCSRWSCSITASVFPMVLFKVSSSVPDGPV